MKKLYTLLFALTFCFANAQNLVTNPTFDSGLTGWTAGPTASYALPTLTAGDGSDGANSVGYVATATTGFYQEIPVTAGANLVISFWYKATGDNSDARIWSNYKDASDVIIYQDATRANDPLRNNDGYLPTAATWTQHTINVTAPANVVKLVLAIRAYSGGTVSFDQFSVTSTLSSSSFNTIENLKVFVNNSNLFVTTNTSDDKQVNIYNMQGREVVNTITSGAGINVSDLASGIYIVKVTENGISETRKIAIK